MYKANLFYSSSVKDIFNKIAYTIGIGDDMSKCYYKIHDSTIRISKYTDDGYEIVNNAFYDSISTRLNNKEVLFIQIANHSIKFRVEYGYTYNGNEWEVSIQIDAWNPDPEDANIDSTNLVVSPVAVFESMCLRDSILRHVSGEDMIYFPPTNKKSSFGTGLCSVKRNLMSLEYQKKSESTKYSRYLHGMVFYNKCGSCSKEYLIFTVIKNGYLVVRVDRMPEDTRAKLIGVENNFVSEYGGILKAIKNQLKPVSTSNPYPRFDRVCMRQSTRYDGYWQMLPGGRTVYIRGGRI